MYLCLTGENLFSFEEARSIKTIHFSRFKILKINCYGVTFIRIAALLASPKVI